MSKQKQKEQSFDFWRDNRTDQHFTMLVSELIAKFKQWLPTKDGAWLNYYGSEAVMRTFLTDKDGISSVFEESQFNDIWKALKPSYFYFMKEWDEKQAQENK